MSTTSAASIDTIWNEFVETRRPELRNELITYYQALVRSIVGRLGIPTTSMLDMDDLLSYGMIGLINAIDRFDPSRGVRFEAFASARIRGAVIDQLRALNWMPRSAVTRVRQIETALAKLEQALGRPPTEGEAATEIGISVEQYRRMLLEVGMMVLSLDAPLASLAQEDDVASLGDLIEDPDATGPAEQVEQHELLHSLHEAINLLPPREQRLLTLYYQNELTMKEISKDMAVSESRVCQLHMQAVSRLRAAMDVRQKNEGNSGTKRFQSTVKPGLRTFKSLRVGV